MLIKGKNEGFVIGNFGGVILKDIDEQFKEKKYCAWRVEFKFDSEHLIESRHYDLEILVYHYL